MCVLLIAAVVSFLPLSANAYLVSLSSFDSAYSSTGQIYGSDASGSTVFYCIDENTTVYVPGSYYAQNVPLTSTELKAAWIENNYAPFLKGAFGTWSNNGHTYDALETAIVVQNAMWDVTGQKMAWSSGVDYDLAIYLASLVPSGDLSYLNSYYARMDLFTDSGYTNGVQDLIRPVPIPAAAWLLGSGLIGLVALRRRFQK